MIHKSYLEAGVSENLDSVNQKSWVGQKKERYREQEREDRHQTGEPEQKFRYSTAGISTPELKLKCVITAPLGAPSGTGCQGVAMVLSSSFLACSHAVAGGLPRHSGWLLSRCYGILLAIVFITG